MKSVIYGFVSAMIAFSFSMMVLTICGHMSRQSESDSLLNAAMERSLSAIMNQSGYSMAIGDEETFAADFMNRLVACYDNDATLILNFVEADYEKGILSVSVTEQYTNPNGSVSSNAVTKTVIIERDERESDHLVTYMYVDESNPELVLRDFIYKVYHVTDGEMIAIVKSPGKEGVWEDAAGKIYTAGDTITVSSDITFYAK